MASIVAGDSWVVRVAFWRRGPVPAGAHVGRLQEVKGGVFTGTVIRPTCYGEGKAEAGRKLAAEHSLDLEQSYFNTDSHEDLPLLELVGRPRPINPNRQLAQIATPGNAQAFAIAFKWPGKQRCRLFDRNR